MYVANQASHSLWQSQTKAKPKWESYIQLLYRTVTKDLGQKTLALAIHEQLRDREFSSPGLIQPNLLRDENPVLRKVAWQLYKDPHYGLEKLESYRSWAALLPEAQVLEKLAFKWELRTYFGLTHD